MKLHEYQAKELFKSFGVSISRGIAARSPAQAESAYDTIRKQCRAQGDFSCNVKAQLHAGGRGKAGGILVATSASEAKAHAEKLLSRRLVTKQTSPEGLPVSAVLLEERLDVASEAYLAVTLDRFHATPVVLASFRGGVDIEEVAATDPETIVREPIDVNDGLRPDQLSRIAEGLRCVGSQIEACRAIICAMWRMYESCDASLIEINPLAASSDGRLVALDAKVTLDDNALFRHEGLAGLRDESQEHPIELKASRIGISYVGLSGTIGCLVNGAGLAMATNDIIKFSGGEPANFLDVGGGANVEQVTSAFSIILSDQRVNAILVNIFGGIMRCDWIAQGLLNATEKLQARLPIVVRLQGTNIEEARRMLSQAERLNLISVDELEDAARKAVELAGG